MGSPPPAVLVLAFNRPSATLQLIDALKPVAPRVVYAAVDGPRVGVADDERRCDEVRHLLNTLPWPHALRTLYREQNLGCGPAVAGAIDWFFGEEPEGVILEDDILPHPSMYRFFAEMLARYREDERVMHVSATNYAGARGDADYFFSRYVSIWGWATWRRAWTRYSFDLSGWRDGPDVLHHPGVEWRARRHLAFQFDRAAIGLGTWDFQWMYAVMRYGLAITPSRNLAVTTGFGADATSLRSVPQKRPQLQEMPLELMHPSSVEADADLDRRLFAEQLSRASFAWELSRYVVPSPRLYHSLGRVVRWAASTGRRLAS
jgi:hypothetical protein